MFSFQAIQLYIIHCDLFFLKEPTQVMIPLTTISLTLPGHATVESFECFCFFLNFISSYFIHKYTLYPFIKWHWLWYFLFWIYSLGSFHWLFLYFNYIDLIFLNGTAAISHMTKCLGRDWPMNLSFQGKASPSSYMLRVYPLDNQLIGQS